MISTTPSSPAVARLARASAIFSGLSSRVVTRPPVERAASASHIVENALDVPLQYPGGAHRPDEDPEQTARVAVMLSMRLGRAVSRASLSSPNFATFSRNPTSVASKGTSLQHVWPRSAVVSPAVRQQSPLRDRVQRVDAGGVQMPPVGRSVSGLVR